MNIDKLLQSNNYEDLQMVVIWMLKNESVEEITNRAMILDNRNRQLIDSKWQAIKFKNEFDHDYKLYRTPGKDITIYLDRKGCILYSTHTFPSIDYRHNVITL